MLPTLLREAAEIIDLGYQLAPGSAEASKSVIARLDLEGIRVAWLVDGDAGGAQNQSDLTSAGIPDARIIVLGGTGSDLTSEDLVDPAVYADAVNEELRRSFGETAPQLTTADLGDTRRARDAEQWCEDNGVPFPNKGAVAHRIADQRSDRRLVDPARLDLVQKLHEQIRALLSPDD